MVNQKGKHNRLLNVAAQGPDLMAHPSYIHLKRGKIHAVRDLLVGWLADYIEQNPS